MAINEIEVNTSMMTVDIEILRTTITQLQTQLNVMFSAINELDQMWDGPANDAFNQQFRKDNEDCKNLCEVLLKLTGCMEHAKNEYNKCESEIRQLIDSIHI